MTSNTILRPADAPVVAYTRGGQEGIALRAAVGRLVELSDFVAVIETPTGRVCCWLGGKFNLRRVA